MSNFSEVYVTVDEWYEGASEAAREHMSNKLAKNGYPSRGVHNAANVYGRGYTAGQSCMSKIGKMTLREVVKDLKSHGVTVLDVRRAWGES